MRYTIQFYGPLGEDGDLTKRLGEQRFEEIDAIFTDLAEARAQAMRHVAPGGQFEWAVALEIMDYDALADGRIHDPVLWSWRREPGNKAGPVWFAP